MMREKSTSKRAFQPHNMLEAKLNTSFKHVLWWVVLEKHVLWWIFSKLEKYLFIILVQSNMILSLT